MVPTKYTPARLSARARARARTFAGSRGGRPGAFSEKDLLLLKAIAGQAAISIANTRLIRKVEDDAKTRGQLSRFLPPHVVEQMEAGGIALVVNTTAGRKSIQDSYSIRRTALLRNIFYCTTLSAAQAATRAIRAMRNGRVAVRSLQEYHRRIRREPVKA